MMIRGKKHSLKSEYKVFYLCVTLKANFIFFGHAAWLVRSLFPDQGLNPCSLQRKYGVLTTGLPENSLESCLILSSFTYLFLRITILVL